MNKKLLLFGAVAVIGYLALTAYKGKTKEEQMAEISQAVTIQLEAYRVEQVQACTDRVMAEAQTRFDAAMAEKAAAAKPGTKKTVKKSGPKVDPLPQPTKPTDSKSKWNTNTPTGTQESQGKWQKAADPNADSKSTEPVKQESKSKWNKAGGN